MFGRLGRFVVHRPWLTIGAWVVIAIALVSFAPKLTTSVDEASFLPKHYESIKASEVQAEAFPAAFTPAAVMVFDRADSQPLTAADSAKVTEIAATLQGKQIAKVNAIVAGEPSPNGLVQMAAIGMEDGSPADPARVAAVKALRVDAKPLLQGTGLEMGITGEVAIQVDNEDASKRAEALIGGATIVLIITLLLIIFRSPIIAFLPVVVIGLVSMVATSLIAYASKWFGLQTDSSINGILIVVLFGVGTDYILFLMFRYRERLRAGEEPKQAMVSAVTRVGEAIASAAGAVIIAFLALTLSSLGMLRAMGPALAIAVAMTLLAGLTLVPAIVSLLGPKVFWPSKAWRSEPTSARFARIGRSMGKRPGVYAGASGLVMVVLAIGALGYHPNFDLASGSTPKAKESMVAMATLQKGLPAGALNPTNVYVQSTSHSPLDEAALTSFGDKLAGVPGVQQVGEPALSKDQATANFTVYLTDAPETNAALAVVKGPLRTVAHADAPAGSTALVGGLTAVYVDIQAAVNRDYSIVFPVAAILIMLILGLLLRSAVAPWYLMASVGLGFGATLGATVLIFQHLQHQAGLMFMLPVIMYLFVVAIGTDYNILMLARLREEAKEGRGPREALSQAIKHTGPTVVAAGAILAGTFASMLLAGNGLMAQMGFAVAFGIAVAAFVMAMFFTPSLTALLGHKAWWPGHGDAARESGTSVEAAAPVSAGELS